MTAPLERYFSHRELACRCCGVSHLHHGFAEKLVELREAWGRPMVVTSGCRCRAHNARIGGAPRSLHQFDARNVTGLFGTCAIDIGTGGWRGADRWALVKLAMDKGWTVGVAQTFLHFDRRADYAALGYTDPILFTY